MQRFSSLLASALLIGAVLFTTGCPGKRDEDASAGLKVLHFGNGAEPQDLDPQVITGSVEHRLMLSFFEGLVAEDPDLNIIPGVAKSWDISEDKLVYTFHLRDDAKWSNGDPVTAEDFVGSYKRMLTPSLAAEYAYMLYHVKGAEEYATGKLKDFSQTGFKALDPQTLQLTLRQPAPFLLHAMNHYAWYPVPVKVVEKFGGLERRGSGWTRPENFVGNGPYILKEWQPNQKMIAERSPTYWDRDMVKIDQIHFYPIESIDTEERMFRTGQLHVTNEVPLSKIPVYQREMPDHIRIDPYNGIYYYRLNTTRKPLDDVRVRRALALSLDRESLIKNVTLGGETPAYQIVPPDQLGYESRHAFKADLDEARRLLAEAGYPEGKGFPRIDILYNTSEKHRTIAEAVQQMWRRNLGIDIGLYNQEWKVYLDSMDTLNFDMARAGWIGDYVDPHVFLDLWKTGGGNNDTGWGDPEYDRLLATVLDAPNDEARFEIYQRMEQIFLQNMPVIPVYFYTRARLISPKVVGYHTTPIDNYPWKYADLRE